MASKKNKPGANKQDREDGDILWRGVTDSITPMTQGKNQILHHTGQAAEKTTSKAPDKAQKPNTPNPGHPGTPAAERAAPTKPKALTLSHGLAPGLDKRTNMRLIKGQLPIEATLDLHGHTLITGQRAFEAFIKSAFLNEKRCVLVITGKGLHLNTGDVGVLRQNVPVWLNGPALRPKVLAFSYATQNDGGQGALYVLLKRRR